MSNRAFETAYNSLFIGQQLGTKHMADCELVWQDAVAWAQEADPTATLKPYDVPPPPTNGPTEQDRDFMALQARKTVPDLLHRESYMKGIEDTVKFYNQKASQ